MSSLLIGQAILTDLPATEKLTLILLANNSNADSGRCDPSQGWLAARMGMERSSVNRIIKRLEQKGHITIIHRFISPPAHSKKGKGSQRSNQYSVHPQIEDRCVVESTPTGVFVEQHRVCATGHTETEGETSLSKGRRMYDSWTLPDEWAAWAKGERPDLNIKEVSEIFRDYYLGVSGSKGIKRDWLATWRNWVRREKKIEQRVGVSTFKNDTSNWQRPPKNDDSLQAFARLHGFSDATVGATFQQYRSKLIGEIQQRSRVH
jgi:DNA-binding Lrp family transcriptional regulator